MSWRALFCAFTWHSWEPSGVLGFRVVYQCAFCKRETWRSMLGDS